MRFESVWDNVFTTEYIDLNVLKQGAKSAYVRQNRFNPRIVLTSVADLPVELIAQKFQYLQMMLKGRCKSMKFFFFNTDSILPVQQLDKLGFKQESPQIFVYEHPDYSVSAISIPVCNEQEWVLQIEKRKGNGLPATACDLTRLFYYQPSLSFDEVVNVS